MKNHEWIDHTADAGVRVYAKNLKTLFKNAAAAMFQLIAKPHKNILQSHARSFQLQEMTGGRKIKIHLDASNREELLIRWLSELISLSDCKRLVFTKFEIEELSDQNLNALVTGQPRKYFSIETEIKAVTYHELKIQKKDSFYSAQIIFDV